MSKKEGGAVMCRKYVRGILFVAGISLLMGCMEAPQSRTTDAGVKQAVRETGENDSKKEESVFVTKTGDGYVCDVALGDDDKVSLRIKGTFEEMEYDNVPVLKVVPSDREFDRDKIKSRTCMQAISFRGSCKRCFRYVSTGTYLWNRGEEWFR